MLGLSATPFSGTSAAKGSELMKFFGGQVFNLPIEEALDKGFLVPYYYYPIYVSSSEEEERKFNNQSRIMASCFRNGKLVDVDTFVKAHRNRLRIISMLEEKQDKLPEIISQISEQDHFVVYCGDGKLFDNNTGEEIRHIQSVKRMLNKFEYKASQFTATENMQERMLLVDSFNKGEISALAAIRCLDEGINIPSIKSALILSSNDDYREFVQRRGRILRTYRGKDSYESITKKECEKEIDLAEDEPADYTYYYKIEYTSDEINNQYEHYSNIDFTEFFTSLMQSLRRAKSDVYGNHHVWKYYDKVKKGVTTRVYILDQQYDHILTIYDEDHEHCYELIPYDDGDQLYIDGELVYTDDFMLQPSHIESNTSTSSGSSQNKKHYSGSSSSSKNKYTHSDPYDAEDYDNADDFAEEWAEEFGDDDYDDGYDDAYDYWEDAMD